MSIKSCCRIACRGLFKLFGFGKIVEFIACNVETVKYPLVVVVKICALHLVERFHDVRWRPELQNVDGQ